jgi:preprotein translocase subunit YajC
MFSMSMDPVLKEKHMMCAMLITARAPGAGGEGASFYGTLPLLIAFFAIAYFLIFRPQIKRQKEHQSMLGNLKKGDKVVTGGGIHGTIVGIKDDVVVVKIAENTKVEVVKQTISARLKE